jgi:nucleotide-binding universal stress UspA family protein
MIPRTILVPVDGTPFGEAAIPIARQLATSADIVMQLVLVHEPAITIVASGDLPVADYGVFEAEGRRRDSGYLETLKSRFPQVDTVLLEGPPGEVLTRHIAETRPQLVVMSTHGRGSLARFWLGSVADHVVRHSTTPVLLIRPTTGEGKTAPVSFARGLVLLDQSPESESILGPVCDFALLTGSALTLMNVLAPVPVASSPLMPVFSYPMDTEPLVEQQAGAQEYLEGVARRVRDRGIPVTTEAVIDEGVTGQVLDRLGDDRYDYVAMATRGATGLERLGAGSTTAKIVAGTHRPVLTARPPVTS